MRVVVVGAGIAGLASAWLIREEARQRDLPVTISLLEAGSAAGGHVRSERVDGFVFERGPSGFLDDAPRTLELVERLGLARRTITADAAAARRYVYHSGRLHEVPTRPLAFLRSSVLPFSAKLRMLAEPFVPPRESGPDETVADFGRRRLGDGFAQYLLDPMVSGIFAGDPEALSLAAAFPKMAALERDHGGLFRALAKRRRGGSRGGSRGGPSGPAGTLTSFPLGMGELTGALATALAGELRTGTPVRGLERHGDRWRVLLDEDALVADRVVLACPAHAAAPLVARLDARAAAALAAIPFAAVSVACEGFGAGELARPLDGFGVLAPRHEGLRVLGVLASDQIFPAHAPPGHRSLRALVGGARDPEAASLDDAALSAVVHRDLDRLVGLRGAPRPSRIYRHGRAIPQYTLGHLDRMAAIDRFAADAGLWLTGASYRGVAVNGCIEDAFRTADAVVASLATARPRRRGPGASRHQSTKMVSR